MRGLPGMLISSERQLEVQSIGIGTLPIRLTLPPDVVALHRGETLPIVFEIQTSNRGQNEVRQEKSTFYVLP